MAGRGLGSGVRGFPCRRCPGPLRAVALSLILVAALPGCTTAPAPPLASAPREREREPFGPWRHAHAASVDALEAHLARHGVLGVLPAEQLLRSASSWAECRAPGYAVPPEAQWPAVVSVLQLVQALTAAGILGPIEVHSGYRDAALNECAGGAARSAHLTSFAIDFTPVAPLTPVALPTAQGVADPLPRLCEFWRTQGRAWRMGFSRYPSGRIHIDTAGYRTWGADHTGRTALCSAG